MSEPGRSQTKQQRVDSTLHQCQLSLQRGVGSKKMPEMYSIYGNDWQKKRSSKSSKHEMESTRSTLLNGTTNNRVNNTENTSSPPAAHTHPKDLHGRVVSILANTAQTCFSELRLHHGKPEELRKLVQHNEKLYQDNLRLSGTLQTHEERWNWLKTSSDSEKTLKILELENKLRNTTARSEELARAVEQGPETALQYLYNNLKIEHNNLIELYRSALFELQKHGLPSVGLFRPILQPAYKLGPAPPPPDPRSQLPIQVLYHPQNIPHPQIKTGLHAPPMVTQQITSTLRGLSTIQLSPQQIQAFNVQTQDALRRQWQAQKATIYQQLQQVPQQSQPQPQQSSISPHQSHALWQGSQLESSPIYKHTAGEAALPTTPASDLNCSHPKLGSPNLDIHSQNHPNPPLQIQSKVQPSNLLTQPPSLNWPPAVDTPRNSPCLNLADQPFKPKPQPSLSKLQTPNPDALPSPPSATQSSLAHSLVPYPPVSTASARPERHVPSPPPPTAPILDTKRANNQHRSRLWEASTAPTTLHVQQMVEAFPQSHITSTGLSAPVPSLPTNSIRITRDPPQSTPKNTFPLPIRPLSAPWPTSTSNQAHRRNTSQPSVPPGNAPPGSPPAPWAINPGRPDLKRESITSLESPRAHKRPRQDDDDKMTHPLQKVVACVTKQTQVGQPLKGHANDGDEEVAETGPDGLRLLRDCLQDLFEENGEARTCKLCVARHERGFMPKTPAPFVGASDEQLQAHCAEEHLEVWEAVRRVE